jgi:hypothetical protein
LGGKEHRLGTQFLSIKNATSMQQEADSLRSRILSELPRLSLGKLHRVAFYTIGAAEAMLLDLARPNWQRLYFTEKFFTDEYFGN